MKNDSFGTYFREHLLDRILLLVGSAGMLIDALTMGFFAGDTKELIGFRIVLMVYCGSVFGLSFFSVWVRKNIYPLVCGMLFGFIAFVMYLNYVYDFGYEYILMMHVGIIFSSIYFRELRWLIIYLVYSYALMTVAILNTEGHFVPANLLMFRTIMTMSCGFGLNLLNRSVVDRLKKSDQRFRLLAESSPDLIALHDADGTIEYVNPAARRMLGYTGDEAIGKNAFSMIHPDDREAARKAYYEHLYLKGESVKLEYRLLKRDGSSMWVEAVGTPMEKRRDRPLQIITTTRDATERKRAEAESLRYQENLLRINNELDQFAYVVSHDLKAPLRGISNLATFIMEDIEEVQEEGADAPVIPDEVSNHLKLMRTRVTQMEQFIEDVLAFSRAGRVGVEWVKIDLDALLRRIVDNLSLPKEFAVELPESTPPIFGARVHFEQVFSNLISNAWKHHHRESGTIKVQYADGGEFHLLSVIDDGPGIPEQYHERIFEVFQQLQPRDQRGGTGVGLAIVRKIVRSAGGRIEIISSPETGTEFKIYWPKDQPESPES